MKQIIVLIATIVLGISLAGTVTGMGTDVQGLADATETAMVTAVTSGTSISYTAE